MRDRRLALLLIGVVACGGSAPPPAAAPAAAPQQAKQTGDEPAPAPKVAAEDDAAIPVYADDATWGSRLAPVTIVEFADFQCPFCMRAAKTISALEETYGAEKLRVVWKNEPLPFHQNARAAAETAQAVLVNGGPQAFWRFHDLAFSRLQDLATREDSIFADWAHEVGVATTQLRGGAYADKVRRDEQLAQRLNATGTPTFFVNGVVISGAQPIAKFKEVIDAELSKAEAATKAGVPADRVYAVATAQNRAMAAASPAAADDDDDLDPKKDKTIFKVPVAGSPVKGSPTALVTMVIFSDFQCPFCKRVEPTVKALEQRYGKDLRLVWKNNPLPFHPRAEPAAELALEALAEKGSAGFWSVHDKLFEKQPKLEDADLDEVARSSGLDLGKVHAAIRQKKGAARIQADSDLAEDLGAQGTPSFFVNGRRVVGAQSEDVFVAVIDEEMARAKSVLATGVAPDKLYDALVKDGRGPAAPDKKTIPASATAPSRGSAQAKVTIVEFSDFQCPFCKRVEDTIAEIKRAYGDKVRFEWRNLPLPFHKDAHLAAEAAAEAYAQKGSLGFWKMHDAMFQAQGSPGGLERPALETYAREAGLDMTKFAAALDGHTRAAAVDADAKVASDAGISGTPAFVINGYFLSGAQPLSRFRRVIDRALSDK